MISELHYNMIKMYLSKEKKFMTIDSIISKINPKGKIELLTEAHASIKKIDKEVFYVEPKYEEIYTERDAKFILFSAPGASGKTALAKHIAYKKDCFYWDLSQIKLGENSFHGTLWRAIGQDKLSDYFEQIKCGTAGLVLDAFDEAEMVSGRAGVEFFLNDLNEITKGGKTPSICLFARTESAVYIAEYCKKNNISYAHYEIGFFEEYNAKKFVKEKILSVGNKVTDAVEKCINEQFLMIKHLLGDEELSKSFIGYAPVLEALAGAFDEERNTIKLLERLKGTTITGTQIIFDILDELLDREHKKVCTALKEKWESKFSEFSDWEFVYTKEEQVVRLVEYILLGEIETDSYYSDEKIPEELYVDYIDVIKLFLPQHPFLQNVMKQEGIDFTGPAFRDYALAYILSVMEYEDFALQYFRDFTQATHFPSQLLFDFYAIFSKGELRGNVFPLMYDSYKAKETAGVVAQVDISDDGEDAYAIFKLGKMPSTEMHINIKTKLFISRLSNSNIDVSGIVCIGDTRGVPRINNSSIICDKIILNCRSLGIEARLPGECLLVSKEDVVNEMSESIDIKVTADRSYLVKVSMPNINSYYKLRPYKYDYADDYAEDFVGFYIFCRKLLSLLRKHQKDVPAKDKDYIDNKIISKSESKRKIMNYLISKAIIFVDHEQSYLYKLNTQRLADYGLSWATLDDKEAFALLYEDYVNK